MNVSKAFYKSSGKIGRRSEEGEIRRDLEDKKDVMKKPWIVRLQKNGTIWGCLIRIFLSYF